MMINVIDLDHLYSEEILCEPQLALVDFSDYPEPLLMSSNPSSNDSRYVSRELNQ